METRVEPPRAAATRREKIRFFPTSACHEAYSGTIEMLAELAALDAPFSEKVSLMLEGALRYYALECAVVTQVRDAGESILVRVPFTAPVEREESCRVFAAFHETILAQRREGRPVFVADRTCVSIPFAAELHAATVIAAPLLIGNTPFGALYLFGSTERESPLSRLESRFAMTLAAAIERELREKRTGDALKYRIEFEQLIATASTDFIGLSADDIDTAIDAALGRIGAFAGVDSSWIFQFSPDMQRMDNSHGWSRAGVPTRVVPLSGLRVADFPWSMEQLACRKTIHVPRVSDLPPEAVRERESVDAFGVRTLIVVPLVSGKVMLGFMGFSSISDEKVWDEEVIVLLTMAGQIFANALATKRSEEERRSLETQMQHAQKLESLGVLTGGIAHDFNNLLMGILGNADLALLQLSDSSPVRERVRKIRKTAQRAAELTNQMLVYSGRAEVTVRAVNISRLAAEMVDLLDTVVSKRAAIRCSLAVNPPAIDADPSQLRQVVMNLVTNASEAVGERNGAIDLSTGVMDVRREDIAAAYYVGAEPKPGRYVFLRVADNGCGMDRETMQKIFDPFFSTKFTGRGLGLAVTLGIVRTHRAVVRVESEPGKGTVFTVLFPASETAERAAAAPSRTAPCEPSGVVLVIDDDECGRQVSKDMLETYGFRVLTAQGGREGIEAFRACAKEVLLVLLDMTMPDMRADEVFAQLRGIRGDVCVVLMSGFSEAEATREFAPRGLAGFIQKPFLSQKLVETVSRAVHAS